MPHTDLRSTFYGGSSHGLPDLQAGLDLVNSLRAGPLEHRGGEKRAGKGIPTHGKFSGTLPPHEASPLDRASVTGIAYQRGRPHRCGVLGDGTLLCAGGIGDPVAFQRGRELVAFQRGRPIRCGTSEGGNLLRSSEVGLSAAVCLWDGILVRSTS
ncbi:hypothetical protein Acsp05_05580 [Actinokineospora sp. NBRC 105648]|nr:hypothetical protein Acsp05_05580 [Actinokineospora sp. NBRC 105648]